MDAIRLLVFGVTAALTITCLPGCASMGPGPAMLSMAASVIGGLANGAVLGGSATKVILRPGTRDDGSVTLMAAGTERPAPGDTQDDLNPPPPTQVADSR